MLTVVAGTRLAGQRAPGSPLPDFPWSVRLAGLRSAHPALELYEAGDLLDVVSSTLVAVPLLRGARSVSTDGTHRAVAWGRLLPDSPSPAVDFIRRRPGRRVQPAIVIKLTTWCWLAIAGGRFDAVRVCCGSRRIQRRLDRS